MNAPRMLLVVAWLSTWTGSVQAREDARVEVLEGHHHRLSLERAVTRVAVGDSNIVDEPTVLSDHELLLLARKTGTTTLMIWFDDGSVESRFIAVRRDYSVLQEALHRIDPGIEIQVAPDRPVLVLSGTVRDVAAKRAAVFAAERYLGASSSPDPGDASSGSAALIATDGALQMAASPPPPEGAVLDLLVVRELPGTLESRVQAALRRLGAHGVEVDRFQRGELPSDADDLLVLRGQVASQTELSRVLQVVSQLTVGSDVGPDDIEVISDESGALIAASGRRLAGSAGSSGGGADLGAGSALSGLFGNGSSTLDDLGNRLGANLARAKALSVAGGRILSFLRVEDLPQVRIDIRVYEVNRTDLRAFAPEVTLSGSDEVALGEDVSAVVSFLAEGFAEALDITAGRFTVDAAFRLLESRGIARNLSGPSLTVLSGERAQFLVGGEVPIPQSFSPALTASGDLPGAAPGVFSSVTFRPFGVQLGVRPLVDELDRVTLDLVTQVARPDAQLTTVLRETTGTAAPSTAFETRALQTSARLSDGEVLLVGGLTDRRSNDDASFTPWIEAIPGLGWLFKRYQIEDEDLEVFVIVSPSILREPVRGLQGWVFPPLTATLPRHSRNP